jgi:hypothetical protein
VSTVEPEKDEKRADAWTSGVGGAQCDRCGDTTIVQSFGDFAAADPLDEAVEWVCLPCYRGDEDDSDEVSS